MTAASQPILDHLQRLIATRAAALPDGELLGRYLEERDESAFAALVERHGPLVLGVCRAMLGHRHDAEDAFQATFLVLARNGRAIRRRDRLASFLHGVAYRVARKARTAAARRQALEARALPVAPAPPVDDLSWGEGRAILHEELAALPEPLREPLVLCYLEGLTQEAAAGRLGWTATTVKGRLQRGRERLRRRLERRGLGLAALAAAGLTGVAVPPALAATVVGAALPVAGAPVSAAAAVLARGVSGPLAPAPVRTLTAVLLLTVALAGGVLLFLRPSADGEPAPPASGQTTPAPEARSDCYGDPLPEGAVARLGTVRFNHGDDLNALTFTPDGKTVVSEGGGSLYLWDAATGKQQARFATAKPSFDDQTTLLPDGKTLLALNQDAFDHDTVRAWDLIQGKEVRAVQLPVRRSELSVYRLNAMAPDGRLAVVHSPENVRVFDLETTREVYRLPKGRDAVQAVVFAGNDLLVTADKKQLVEVWESRTGKPVRQFDHGSPVVVLAASADGRRLATLEHHADVIGRMLARDVVHVWDLTTGTQQQTLAARPQRWYVRVRFTPDGKRLLTSSIGSDGHELTLWDVETGQRVREWPGVDVRALAVSPDGGRVAAGAWGRFDLWDLQTGRRLSDADAPHALAAGVFLSPAGARAITVGYESFSTWDGKTGRRLGSFELSPLPYRGPEQNHSPDGRYALSFAGDFKQVEILVWDVAAGRRLHTLRPPGASRQSTTAFSPDSSLLATCQPGEKPLVRLWDVRTGQEVRSFAESKAGWPGHLFFTPDGRTLLVAGRRTVGYDVATGEELFSWRMQPLPNNSGGGTAAVGVPPPSDDDRLAWRTLAVSPDGKVVACILNGDAFSRERLPNRVVFCETRTGKVLRRADDAGVPGRSYEQLAFSADSRLLASSEDDVVHVWEVATATEVGRFRGHRGYLHALAFSADGRRLASAGTDSTVLLWDVTLPARSSGEVGAKELAGWWADLAGSDGRRAYAAVWRLAEAPPAVPFLRQQLKPVTEAQAAEVRQYIADLDSNQFPVRDKALRQLEGLGVAAEPALRQAAEQKASPEVRRRLDQLLERLSSGPVSGEPLRTVRALAVLEHAGTPEARQLLRELADGAPGAWLTQEAQAAQGRVARLPVGKP
jgi:RNA polymerase sigma factor (sigma-70 family)